MSNETSKPSALSLIVPPGLRTCRVAALISPLIDQSNHRRPVNPYVRSTEHNRGLDKSLSIFIIMTFAIAYKEE